jgi:hypothetical protein
MHTSLLDAVPITSAICRLPAGKIFEPSRSLTPLAGDVFAGQRSANNRLRVIDSSGVNHLVVVHPGDLQWISLAVHDNRSVVDCRLRIRNLEKGVIRRARMFYAKLDSNADADSNYINSALSALADEFENSQLPLSA